MNKTTALKAIAKPVPGDARSKDHKLYLSEHEGETWATNSYWLAPARWFADLLPDGAGPGVYCAKSSQLIGDDAPNVGRLLPHKDNDWKPLEATILHGHPVILVDAKDGHDLELYEVAGNEVALRRAYVDMFRGEVGSKLVLKGTDGLKPVAAYETTSYVSATDGRQEGLRLIGLIMPVRLSK